MIALRQSSGCLLPLVLLLAGPLSGHGANPTPLTAGEDKFSALVGHECPVIRLWPAGQAPDEPHPMNKPETATTAQGNKGKVLRIQMVTEPSMVIISPPKDKNTGIALILSPGGGYGSLGSDLVKEVSDWFTPRGITCVLLKYRVPKRRPGYDMGFQPLQDAQRAMGILRGRAAEFGIDPNKIGFGGFSAGGNLAAKLLMNFKTRTYKPVDAYDNISCRPDFAVLCYPAYLTMPIPSRNLAPKMGYENLNAKDTPPTFMTITFPDKFTFGTMEMYLSLQKAGVASELHIYPEGGHGGGIKQYPFGEFAKECERFFAQQKIFPAIDEFTAPAPASPKVVAGQKIPLGGTDATLELIRPTGATNHKAVIILPDATAPAAASTYAAWFSTIGLTSIILEPGKTAEDAIEKDLTTAMTFARSKAHEWGVDAQQIGLCGIGSGARAAALAAATAKKTAGPLNPAFIMLLSPKGLADPAHPGKADPALIDVRRVLAPHLFLAMAASNPDLPALADYYLGIEPKRVYAECHVYHESDQNGAVVPADLTVGLTRWIKDLDRKEDPKAAPEKETKDAADPDAE